MKCRFVAIVLVSCVLLGTLPAGAARYDLNLGRLAIFQQNPSNPNDPWYYRDAQGNQILSYNIHRLF